MERDGRIQGTGEKLYKKGNAMQAIQLLAIDGDLYYPPDSNREYEPTENLILVHRYPEGDADTISWPNPNRKVLRACLFDDRECGTIQDQEVLLPDGTSAWK